LAADIERRSKEVLVYNSLCESNIIVVLLKNIEYKFLFIENRFYLASFIIDNYNFFKTLL